VVSAWSVLGKIGWEKYYGRPGNERVFRLGMKRDF
jgi:hypothetical protein